MAPTIPVGEPTSVTAGDSWVFKQSFPEYPVSEGWALAYAFAGPGDLLTATSEVANDAASTYTLTIPASRTELPTGTYRWVARMTGSGAYAGQVYTVRAGVIEVCANVTTSLPEALWDPDERLLFAIDAVIYGRITDDVQQVTIGGRSVTKIPIAELLALKSRLERRVYLMRNGGDMPVRRVIFS